MCPEARQAGLGWAGLGVGAQSTNHWEMNDIHHGLLPPRTGDTFVSSGMSLRRSTISKLVETDLAAVQGAGIGGSFFSGQASEQVSSLPVFLQTLAQELSIPHGPA